MAKDHKEKFKDIFRPLYRMGCRIIPDCYIRYYYDWVKWLFAKRYLPADTQKVLLHIGCGQVNAPKFINIDAYPYPHVHYIRNIKSDALWKKDSADLIYACHVLEHVEMDKLEAVLSNWRAFLKKGGVLRLSVPDFDSIIKIYELSERKIHSIVKPLMGGQDHKLNFHYSIFNEESLNTLLLNAGFSKVQPWNPADCAYHNFNDWANFHVKVDGKRVPISLNVEGIK